MYKALLAAAVAMLGCCAAAAWAAPAEPVVAPNDASAASAAFDVMGPVSGDVDRLTFAPLEPHDVRPISALPNGPELTPSGQAVIPLPPALYAGAATGALAVFLRRRLLRALC